VVFLGIQARGGDSRSAEGDEQAPLPAELTPPPGYPTPPPDLPTPAPLDYRDFPPLPEETAVPVDSLVINGTTVPLVPGMVYGIRGAAPPLPRPGTDSLGPVPQPFHFVEYSAPGTTSRSWAHFDERGESGRMKLLTASIRPEDQAFFRPLIEALD